MIPSLLPGSTLRVMHLCNFVEPNLLFQGKHIDAFAAHPGTAKTAIWDKMDKNKVEGVAFDLTAKVRQLTCFACVDCENMCV